METALIVLGVWCIISVPTALIVGPWIFRVTRARPCVFEITSERGQLRIEAPTQAILDDALKATASLRKHLMSNCLYETEVDGTRILFSARTPDELHDVIQATG